MRKRLYEVLEVAKPNDQLSRMFDVFIISLILLNVVMLVISTVPEIGLKYANAFEVFEALSVAIFTIEYIGRIYSCVENPGYSKMITGRARYMYRPLLLIDLLAILPFYLTALDVDLRSLRAIRMIRILRLFKLFRYVKALDNIGKAVREKTPDRCRGIAQSRRMR